MKLSVNDLILIALLILMITFHSCCRKCDVPPVTPLGSVTLGVILPMDQEKGVLREKALRAAIDAINEAGGVGIDYRIDLILFHIPLARYVLLEIKISKFMHAHAGQINFYLNWAKDHLHPKVENDPLGIILCLDKSG